MDVIVGTANQLDSSGSSDEAMVEDDKILASRQRRISLSDGANIKVEATLVYCNTSIFDYRGARFPFVSATIGYCSGRWSVATGRKSYLLFDHVYYFIAFLRVLKYGFV